MAEAEAVKKREQHANLIRRLERAHRIERALENLPTEDQLSKLALKGRGITRPDIAILVSHTKLWLKDLLLKSDILTAPILRAELLRSFPKRLHAKFAQELENHQLHSEIIATNVSNQIVNRAGLTFVTEIEEETTREVFEQLWPLTEGRRVCKRRHYVPDGDLIWELDEFLDRELVLAEVELPSVGFEVEPPGWLQPVLLREVTGEPDYLNVNLAR